MEVRKGAALSSATEQSRSMPNGYKQTEVGLIPEDWEVVRIGECFVFKNGLNKEKHFFGQGTPIVNYMDVYKNSEISSKDLNGSVTLSTQELRNYDVKKGDVFFTRTSETVEEIGISTVVVEDLVDTVFSGFVLRGRPINLKFELKFKKYCFSSANIRKQIASTASYTTRALTNGRLLSEVKIALPTKSEQTAIATTLRDADTLITSLERLIEKKRAIKQGAMQELLKPKEGWEVKKLGEIAPLQRGFDLPNRDLQQGTYPVVYSNGIVNYHNKFQAKAPGIVTGRSGTIGKVTFVEEDYWPHNTALWVTDFKGNYPKFIFYLFLKIKLDRFATGSGVPTLNRNDVHDFQIAIPPIETQTRIATILSDMDAELTALEQKLAKYNQIKHGMMQELLTGRIRLI